MARPKGSLNKATLAKMAETGGLPAPYTAVDNRTDEEVLRDITEAFTIYRRFGGAVCEGVAPSLMACGSAGMGKTHTAESVVDTHKIKHPEAKVNIVKGTILGMDLYDQAYQHRRKGDVLILDDADSIWENMVALNILKALLDSSKVRKVSWLTNHPRVNGEGGLPNEFIYEGSIFFLSNKNIQRIIDVQGQNWEHLAAVRDRTICLDLNLHTRRECALWIGEVVRSHRILQEMGLSPEQEQTAMEWIKTNRDKLVSLSIRTARQVGTCMLMGMTTWENDAKYTLLRRGA